MKKRGQSFGHDRERKVRDIREEDGWFVIRAPGSLGFADLVCLKAGEIPRMTEVKGTAGGPFEKFGPAKRKALIEAAKKAGAIPELAYWPAYGDLRFIPEDEWPR